MASFSLLCVLSLILIVGSSSHIAHAQDSPTDFVNTHNAARRAIDWKISDLVWDDKIADYAQNYANQRKDCKATPSDNGGLYGENIAVSTSNMSGVEAVNLWVAEKPHYNTYTKRCIDGECSHYVQVVWGKSQRVGCGKVKCDNGGTFITCNYYPASRFPGEPPF